MVETGANRRLPEAREIWQTCCGNLQLPILVFFIIFVFKNDSFISERDLAMALLPHSGFCKHE